MAVLKKSAAFAVAGLSLSAALLIPTESRGQEAEAFFKQNCVACHTIGGGRRVGPDLKGVTERQDREWLVNFITDPQGVLASGDPYAIKLKSDMGGAMMIKVPGITPEMANKLLDYIQAESGIATAAAPTPAQPPPLPRKIVAVPALFVGDETLSGGAPPCISCHAVDGLPGLGGGRLGPDLTLVAGRLGGREGLSAWLSSTPTPTMRSVFANHRLTAQEIAVLAGYLEQTNANGQGPVSSPRGGLFLAGVGGASACLVVFGLAWRRRLKGVRTPLVQQSRKGVSDV